MRPRAIIATALAFLALGACNEQSGSTYADAQSAFAANEYSKSRVILLSVLDRDPNDQQARTLLVQTLLKMSDGWVAERYLDQIPEADLDPIRRLELEAQSLIVKGNPEAAIAVLLAGDNREEWTATTYEKLLWAHQNAGSLEAHENELAEAVNRFPEAAGVHARAALFFKSLDEWDKVEAAVGYALEADPDHFDARLLAGELAIREGELEAALPIYEALADDFPDFAVPISNVVGLKIDMALYDAAEVSLKRALARHPDFLFLKYQQARLYFERGDHRRSRDILQARAHEFKRLTPALILSAQIDLALGNREIARAQLATAARDGRFADEIQGIMQAAELTEL